MGSLRTASTPSNPWPGPWRVLLVSLAVVLGYLLLLRYETDHGRLLPNRWLSDDGDRGVYYTRAQFLPDERNPYLDARSEYPTLATLAFTIPLLLSPDHRMSAREYRFAWSCLMAAVLLATIALVAHVRVRHGLSSAPALILLTPSLLYFSLMRFDVLCAFLLCLSLVAFGRARYVPAHVLLGVASFVKWYPALVFPVYAAFHWSQDRTSAARRCAPFLLTVAILTAATIAAFTWQGFLAPYRFHATRGGQYFNLYWLVTRYVRTDAIDLVFFALQLAIVPMLAFTRIRTARDVLRYAILAIYLFITFAKIDSPQWILWYVPVALLFVREPRTLVALMWLGILNYLVFPVAYDTWGWLRPSFSMLVAVKDVSLLVLVSSILSEDETRCSAGRLALDER